MFLLFLLECALFALNVGIVANQIQKGQPYWLNLSTAAFMFPLAIYCALVLAKGPR